MSIYHSLCEVSEKWPEFSEVTDKLRSIKKRVVNKVVEIVSLREERFNVITHGDYWINNLLFKINETINITDMRMVS